VGPAAAAPSFDCAKAGNWVEHTLCANAALGDLDRRMADLYAARVKATAADGAARLREAQRAWARGRAACETEANATACLEQRYRQRIAELEGADLPGWSAEVATAIRGIDACLAATPSVAIVVTELRRDGDSLRLTLRGAHGRSFACRAALDGRGMAAVHDAEAGPTGPVFRRGLASPCPSATPLTSADGQTLGWMTPATC
jgi:uncharacterized protein YecT (DUF1311 family)